MLVEKYFSEKVKGIVSSLENTGRLNRETLDRLNNFYYKQLKTVLLSVLFLCLVAALCVPEVQIYFVGLIILGFLLEYLWGRSILHRFVPLYVNGKGGEGVVISASLAVLTGWNFKYRYIVDDKEYTNTVWCIYPDLVDGVYEERDTIRILYDRDNPQNSVPDLPKMRPLLDFKAT